MSIIPHPSTSKALESVCVSVIPHPSTSTCECFGRGNRSMSIYALLYARSLPPPCSYNAVNGIPSCANSFLNNDLARAEWGFDSVIVSDCDAVGNILVSLIDMCIAAVLLPLQPRRCHYTFCHTAYTGRRFDLYTDVFRIAFLAPHCTCAPTLSQVKLPLTSSYFFRFPPACRPRTATRPTPRTWW